MKAVIMAGGKGTRLKDITLDQIPKPMAPICGKPILEHQILCLAREGIHDIIIVTGYLGYVIQEYFGSGSRFGVSIQYYNETEPLGTAGALFSLKPLLEGDDSFILVFGDLLFDIDIGRMQRFHNEHDALVTLFVHPNTHPFDSDLVQTNNEMRVSGFLRKSMPRLGWYDNCVNAGLYMMKSAVCELSAEGQKMDLEKQLLARLIESNDAVYAYHSPEYVKDVGTVERISEAADDLERGVVAQRCLHNKQRAIFLDRDGTLNKQVGLVSKEEQLVLEDRAADALRLINRSGYLAIVITNQPSVARGLCQIEDIERIHRKLETLLGSEGTYLDDILFCPHHPDKGFPEENPAYKIKCSCRKPGTLLLEKCAEKYQLDMSQCWFIGDTTIDIKTGRNAGTKTALVLTGEGGKDKRYADQPDLTGEDILDVVRQILILKSSSVDNITNVAN